MKAVGIIAEFNPFHLGHKYLIDRAKENGDWVVCVLSGNFVQRGDVALLSKQARALAALSNGVDLCIELPVAWSMSTAQNFAFGGISLLKNLGLVDAVVFGSECGDIDVLKNTAAMMESINFKTQLEAQLASGQTFAAARQAAARIVFNDKSDVLSYPNNILGIEYISAAKRLSYSPAFVTYKRLGADHGSSKVSETASAEYIRSCVLQGNIDECADYMDAVSFDILKKELEENRVADINNIETAIIAGLRLQKRSSFANLPDISEGIENRLFSFVKSSTSLPELYKLVKTKRYTLARIRRTVLSAFLQIDNSYFNKQPPYIKILGFNEKGEKLLKAAAKTAKAPIITRAKDINELGSFAKDVFACECRATDIFALTTTKPLPCGLEYTEKIVKV